MKHTVVVTPPSVPQYHSGCLWYRLNPPWAPLLLYFLQYQLVFHHHPVLYYPFSNGSFREGVVANHSYLSPFPVTDDYHFNPFGNNRRTPFQNFKPPETFFFLYGPCLLTFMTC
jgi:hypothetical protein